MCERGKSVFRTLASLKQDHQNFINAGANLRNAKDYNNVIEENMFDIPIDQVRGKSVCFIQEAIRTFLLT